MDSQHNLVQAMKAYLLGILPPEDASALEERYFLDRTFFLNLEKEENQLIAGYLENGLSPEDRRRFEDRYLRNPLLLAKVEQARAAHVVRRPVNTGWNRAVLAAAAVVIMAVAGLTFRLYREKTVPEPVTIARADLPLDLRLSPGVTKGPDSTSDSDVQGPLPAAGVRLFLELPGRRSSITAASRVWRIESDGQRSRVWETPNAVSSTATASEQQHLVVLVPSSVLRPGDYLVDITDSSSSVLETYLFRVIASK